MSNIDGAPAPDDAAGPGPGADGPPMPDGGGGLLASLRSQQAGPDPSAVGQGDQANSLLMLKSAVDIIQKALAGLDPGSPQHRDALNAARQLSRHLASGSPTAGAQQTQLTDIIRMIGRSALLQNLRGGKGGGGGGPPAPMPSTPLPGA